MQSDKDIYSASQERLVYRAAETSPATFNRLVYEGAKENPFLLLTELRETISSLSDPQLRTVSAEDAKLCIDRFKQTTDMLHNMGRYVFEGNEDVRWHIGRVLDKLEEPDKALEHLGYVCSVVDSEELRPKAFARLAEVNLSQFFNTQNHDYVGPAYEAAAMAHFIEGSHYTGSLFQKADQTLYESWKQRYGNLYPARQI